jgi:3' terminal RNA ribose 2'-O-methyltransferase Hen1
MLLSITSRTPDATDLGYLLHKNPANIHTTSLSFGEATVFFSKAQENICTAHLMVEVDPIALVRGKGAVSSGWALGQYVNDRPYAASSFLSTAISRCYGTAMSGRCMKKPDLVERELDLEINIPALPLGGAEGRIREMFEPLGYTVEIEQRLLDEHFPTWGMAKYSDTTLRTCAKLSSVLRHLFVLIPALDSQKHYWIGTEEIDKLLEKGEGWLDDHPMKEWITTRYLKFQRPLISEALGRLSPEIASEDVAVEKVTDERQVSLHDRRLDRVTEIVKEISPESVIDLGCGGGKLLQKLLNRTKVPRILGMDVDSASLEIAKKRLHTERMADAKSQRISLAQGSLTYRDSRMEGYDLACLVEVIEHLEPERIEALERVVFRHARPNVVLVTTPNSEYNVLFENLGEGKMRHGDHRFEWSRAEFGSWSNKVAEEYGYHVEIEGLGDADPTYGSPSQLARFTLKGGTDE